MIGQFWQLILAFQNESITWLRACRVKQIWQACDALICHTFWHFEGRKLFSGSGQGTGWTEVFKMMLTGYPHFSSRSTIFHCLPNFFSPLQTCQPLIKENLETHEKKSGDSKKCSEIPFFSPIKIKRIFLFIGGILKMFILINPCFCVVPL